MTFLEHFLLILLSYEEMSLKVGYTKKFLILLCMVFNRL